jgi:hypothetical protein
MGTFFYFCKRDELNERRWKRVMESVQHRGLRITGSDTEEDTEVPTILVQMEDLRRNVINNKLV